MKRFCICSLWSHLNVLTFPPPNRGMLRRSRCALIFLKKQNQCSTSSSIIVVILYYYVGCKNKATTCYLKKNQNESRPSEHPLVRGEKNVLGWIKGCKYETCKYKTSSWHLNGFRDGNNIGSTDIYNVGEKPTKLYYTLTLIVMQGHQKTNSKNKTEAM